MLNYDQINKYQPIAKRVGRGMAGVCKLSPSDAEQEALVALLHCVEHYGDKLNAGMVAISTRNHLLHIAERNNAGKRKGITVHHDGDIYPAETPSAEQLAIAADTERRIDDACEALGMSSEQTLALGVVLHTLSSTKYQAWVEAHPVEWAFWMNAAEMTPERAAELSSAEARKLFVRLMSTLRSANWRISERTLSMRSARSRIATRAGPCQR